MSNDQSTDWLYELLNDVDLVQFANEIRGQLQVTRLEHFEYVDSSDLEKIGVSKPAARRLLDAARKRKSQQKRKNLIHKLIPSSSISSNLSSKSNTNLSKVTFDTLNTTCLIQEKDIRSV